LKKRSKKLLILNADVATRAAERRKSFLVLFFKKNKSSPLGFQKFSDFIIALESMERLT